MIPFSIIRVMISGDRFHCHLAGSVLASSALSPLASDIMGFKNITLIGGGLLDCQFAYSPKSGGKHSLVYSIRLSSVSNRASGSTGFDRWAFSPACMLR